MNDILDTGAVMAEIVKRNPKVFAFLAGALTGLLLITVALLA